MTKVFDDMTVCFELPQCVEPEHVAKRRVFMREKPKTVVKIYEATQTGGAGVWMIQK
jgi:hypothetical protein